MPGGPARLSSAVVSAPAVPRARTLALAPALLRSRSAPVWVCGRGGSGGGGVVGRDGASLWHWPGRRDAGRAPGQ